MSQTPEQIAAEMRGIKLEHGINQMALRFGASYARSAKAPYGSPESHRASRQMDRRFAAIQRMTRALANLGGGA